MGMTQTKTTKLRKATSDLRAEIAKAGDGSTNLMPKIVGRIERVLISEGLVPELTPFNSKPGETIERCFIHKWYDEDGKEIAEARHAGLIHCRCESALIAADSILPKKPGRPPKNTNE